MTLFERRSKKRVSHSVHNFFRWHQTGAFGTHGTLSENLPPIKKTGLRSNEKMSFWRITPNKLMAAFRKSGAVGVYREVHSVISNNLGYARSAYTKKHFRDPIYDLHYPIPFGELGVVIGRVGAAERNYEAIPAENVLLTLSLSASDIARLNAKFPGCDGNIPPAEDPHIHGKMSAQPGSYQLRERVIREVAHIFTKKAIRELAPHS